MSKEKGTGKKDQSGVTFDRNMKNGPATYELYTADDAEKAKTFLLSKNVTKGMFYIEVTTPDGTWGVDKDGLYLVELLPWQKDVSRAEEDGEITQWPSLQATMVVKQGLMDNAVAMVKCGKCNHEWWDGIQLDDATVVRCPKCKAYNKISGGKINVHSISV